MVDLTQLCVCAHHMNRVDMDSDIAVNTEREGRKTTKPALIAFNRLYFNKTFVIGL